jgi:hypothetical protein
MTDAAARTRTLVSSPDGQWVAARTGRRVTLLAAGTGPAVAHLDLAHDDVDLGFVGPPAVLVTVTRDAGATRVALHPPPELTGAAPLELDGAACLAAITGPRFALTTAGRHAVTVVRAAGHALATQVLEVGMPVEFAVGLERNQLLLGLSRKLEVWDAASGRALLRPQFQLPPAPRMVGAAAGHLWATKVGQDAIYVYRLSDGRPFRNLIGAPVLDVICHPASPLIVAVTPRGLVRVNCYAHSVLVLAEANATPDAAYALLVAGDDVSLLGLGEGDDQPWQLPIAGAGAPAAPASGASGPRISLAPVSAEPVTFAAPAPAAASTSSAPRPSAAPGSLAARVGVATRPVTPRAVAGAAISPGWRDAVAAYGEALHLGTEAGGPSVPSDSELGALADRLGLGATARRTLTILYARYLVGEPRLPIARLAQLTDGWAEALGQGELGALAMLRRKHGTVALRSGVTDVLDGVAPRTIRLVGDTPTAPRAGAFRIARDGRPDAEIETDLAQRLGRIGVATGPLSRALLEARLHGATAVTMQPPGERPTPWPDGAGLVLVLYGATSSWIADVPQLD